MRPNCYDNAEVFCTGLTLWKERRLPPDVERVFCDVLRSIVWMATMMLVKEKKYAHRRQAFCSEDVQSLLVLHALEKAKTHEIDTSVPRTAINFFVTATQNRLRDLDGFLARRRHFSLSTGPDLDFLTQCRDFFGEKRTKERDGKANTQTIV